MKKVLKIVMWTFSILLGALFVLAVVLFSVGSLSFSQGQRDWNTRLENGATATRNAPPYDTVQVAGFPIVKYADPVSDPEIARVGEYFKIDQIAGSGDEISRMKNIMTWVWKNVKWDGNKSYPGERNSIALYEYHRDTGLGINCRMVATLANELYLAAGFASRFVTGMPADSMDVDAHVINAVWSRDKAKWLWMDSSFGTWVEGPDGELLSVPEVRERVVRGEAMTLNPDGDDFKGEGATYYLDRYMAKNLFWMGSKAEYRFNTESRRPRVDGMLLTPPGFEVWSSQASWHGFVTHNSEQFWQPPWKNS